MTQDAAQAPIVLIDGSSYLFRAYHALPPLMTSKGQATGAIKGVISMIRRLQQDYPGATLVAVFDAKGKNFRHELYEQYKANRPPMPEELASQIEPIFAIVRAMGLPLLIEPGVEADDVIGTLAHQATSSGREAIISTGDKDMAQLVSEHVTLINTMTESKMDRDGVKEKFGVTPEQIIDYLALVGDTSDNIPGVNKCGPKTAVKWLQEYQTIDNLMANADQIKGKIGEYLRQAEAQLPCSRDLATIRTNVALEHTLENTRMSEPDRQALLALYREYEFKSWIAELEAGSAPEIASSEPAVSAAIVAVSPATDYQIITEQAQLERWLQRLQQAGEFAFDTETTGLNYMTAEIVGVSFAIQAGEAAYVPLMHDYMGAPEQLDREQVLEALKPLLESAEVRKIGQNLKYDMNILANHGITLAGIAEDTMLQSYVLNSVASRHDMDTLALQHLERQTTSFTDIAGKGVKQLTFNAIDVDIGGHYACEDADITLLLHQTLRPQLAQVPTLDRVYREIDMPLVPILACMERRGARVNPDLLRRQSQELAEKMATIEEAAYTEAGEKFNLGSPKQLQTLLYDKLGLPTIKKTPKGAPSTAEPVLAELALDHALPRLILDYRSLSKLKSTYTDRLPELINPRTGRIHTSYHQAVTATGRLSSSDPNLQNIPIRTEEGRRIRQAFIATDGYKLVAADYSQIELRIMAHLSGDPGLLEAFANREDIHKATAAEVFGVPLAEVNNDQRRSAKAINFGLIYGMSAWGLGRQLGIGRETAQAYVDRYFERYPGVLDYMDRTRALAHEQGYVETLFGRRLYLPEINNRNRGLQQGAERTAINAPMQGSAADIIKRAMIAVEHWLHQTRADAQMIMQVHDELILEVREEDLPHIIGGLEERMSAAAELKVPLLVETGVGDNWDQAH